jgi:outer membrane protein assembly factor BamB
LTLSYDIEKYRQGTYSSGFSVQLFYSTNGTTWTNAGTGWKTAFAADTTNNGYASAPGMTQSVTGKTLRVSLANGDSVYLAWSYSGSTTSNNAQALAIDNISVTPIAVMAGAAIKSSPTAYEGKVYFGSDDGKLYGMDIATGNTLPGFPAVVSTTAKIRSRPALRFLADGQPYLFLTSTDGVVYKYDLSGNQKWATTLPASSFVLLSGTVSTSCTPAVDGNGNVFVGAVATWTTTNTRSESRMFRLDAATGAITATSPPLNSTTYAGPASTGLGSPCMDGSSVYVTATYLGPAYDGYGVFVLDADLVVRASFAKGEMTTGSPFFREGFMYVGIWDGKVYKVNAANFNPETGWGNNHNGSTSITSLSTADPVTINSSLYVTGGKAYFTDMLDNFYYLNVADGTGPGPGANPYLLLQTPTTGSFAGVAVDPTANGGHGAVYAANTGSGTDMVFYEVPLDNPGAYVSYPLANASSTLPTIDISTNKVLVGDDGGLIYRFPRL